MKYLTKIAGILFAYSCEGSARFCYFVFTPLGLCFGGKKWREQKERNIKRIAESGARRTAISAWLCLIITLMVLYAKILERFVYKGDSIKVANGTIVISGITILPFVIWWIRNRDSIMNVQHNLLLGENNKAFYYLTSIIISLFLISAPFIALCL